MTSTKARSGKANRARRLTSENNGHNARFGSPMPYNASSY